MKLKPLFLLGLTVSALCGTAHAQASRLSVTGSAGVSFYTLYRSQYRNAQFGTTGNQPSILSVRDHDVSYQLGAGFQITPRWSADIGYLDGGTIRIRGIAPISAGVLGAFSTGIHQTLWRAGASFRIPNTDRIGFLASAGFARWKNEYKNTGVAITGMHDESGTSPYLGFAVVYDLRPNINLNVDLTYQAGHQTSTRLSGGIRFRF